MGSNHRSSANTLRRVLPFLLCGCAREPAEPAPPASPSTPSAESSAPNEGAAWLLAGSNDERFARVAKHLRGFDMAMVEVGYRYGELYWAGQDQNWELAKYQLDKIRTAVANGVERRPKRARSALALEPALVSLQEAITGRDLPTFQSRFQGLTNACNTCHEQERVGFMHVAPPSARLSPVRPPPTAGTVE